MCISAQFKKAERQRVCGCFLASYEKGHHIINHIFHVQIILLCKETQFFSITKYFDVSLRQNLNQLQALRMLVKMSSGNTSSFCMA
jgi:hypothetical protein